MATKILFLFFCCEACVTGREFYSSTDKMINLVEKEEDMLSLFSTYIKAEEEHLQQLRSILVLLKLIHYTEKTDLETSNPVAAYILMQRLRIEWAAIMKYTKQSLSQTFQEYLEAEFLNIPHQEDMDGAALGIIRLQELYNLYPQNITKDPLTGEEMSLSSDEAYHLGTVAYNHEMFQHAFLWFLQSLNKLNKASSATVTKKQLLRLLGTAAYHHGNLPFAIYFTQQLVQLDPTNEEARLNLAKYKGDRFTQLFNSDILRLHNTSDSAYMALCRGEANIKASKKQRQLSCRYSTGEGNPRLMYAPMKVEEEWDDPPIVRYHDIISERETELLKNLSRPSLTRPKVYSEGKEVFDFHVAQSAWLTEEDDPVVDQIFQRVSDITGLYFKSNEALEVLNYGVGGHVGPHYDGANRTATIIFYLSDVEVGGATVFPKLGVSLKPEKGSAVMWYNLLRNGKPDEMILHAGCPVFHGSKWIASKWVHEEGQEFRRPCSLSETE